MSIVSTLGCKDADKVTESIEVKQPKVGGPTEGLQKAPQKEPRPASSFAYHQPLNLMNEKMKVPQTKPDPASNFAFLGPPGPLETRSRSAGEGRTKGAP